MRLLRFFFFLVFFAFTSIVSAACVAPDNYRSHGFRSANSIAEQLGWVSDPCIHNLCEGYYELSAIDRFKHLLQPLSQCPVEITASESSLSLTGTSRLTGKVSVTEPGRLVEADEASVTRNEESGNLDQIDFVGNVRLQQPGQLIVARKAHINWPEKTGYLRKVLYRLLLNDKTLRPTLHAYGMPATCRTCQSSAWGQADSVEQKPSGVIVLKNATYSTCSPVNTTWKLVGSSVELDRQKGRGCARNVSLRVKDIPVLYLPYLSFPLEKTRKTGFLFPTVGSSQDSGFNIGIPFYWNMAPNYDDTFMPRYYSERGIQLNNLFRYLTAYNVGNINLTFLPSDRSFSAFKNEMAIDFAGNPALDRLLTARNSRYFLSWEDSTRLNSHWFSKIYYNQVSDDYYFQDFGSGSVLSMTNQLLQQASLTYISDLWTFVGQVQGYQTLHPVNQSVVSNQYARLPQFSLSNTYPLSFCGLNYQFNGELVHFEREKNPGEIITPPAAERLNIQPQISWPLIYAAGYFTPTLQLSATGYEVSHPLPAYPTKIERFLPIFDINTGLYFDRCLRWFGRTYRQTFEPRLFYLYVPFRDQNNIPIFDTTAPVFNVDQLFRTNRFTGIDRIGDANQITLAATTRFLCSETGEEKANASIGEIFYFQDRRVTLCNELGCQDIGIGAVPPKNRTSPIVGQVNYFLNSCWNINVNAAWDPNSVQMQNTAFNFQYKPSANCVFNLGYNFIRNGDILQFTPSGLVVTDSVRNLNQTAFSFAWPLNEHWSMIGNWNYNLSRGFSQTYFGGIEYNGCCFAIRAVGGRTYTALNQNGTPIFGPVFYLQWQLKGLGNFGNSDPTALLKGNIAGYHDVFD